MSKMTPGPWRTVVEWRGSLLVECEVVCETATIATLHATTPIDSPDRYGPIMPQAAAANATAIAALPDLIAALRGLVASRHCDYAIETMDRAGYFDHARAALAKAGVTT